VPPTLEVVREPVSPATIAEAPPPAPAPAVAISAAPPPVPAPEPAPVAVPEAAIAAAPPPAEGILWRRELEGLRQIQFETDRDVIRPESEEILRAVASILSRHPEVQRVRVEGHTDAKGSAPHNTHLSDRRARAVTRWLVERGGIDPARLEARGYGPGQPVADNATEEGRASNRRVVFRIVE
jgi:outer membrane protein OmpA-like peptidoglycan-associated protein